jgi:hypothetical protein
VNSWCGRWKISINEGKSQAIYFSRRVPDDVLQLNGRNKPFVNNLTYLGMSFDMRMAWRHHIERTETKALLTYIKTYSLFKSRNSSTNDKLMLYKTRIRSVITYACPAWKHAADSPLETAGPAEQSIPRYWRPRQVNTCPQNSLRVWLNN